MCGGGAPKAQRRDLEAERLEAERKATEKANAEIAYRRSRRRSQSLIANPSGAAGLSSLIAQPALANPAVGKDTLG